MQIHSDKAIQLIISPPYKTDAATGTSIVQIQVDNLVGGYKTFGRVADEYTVLLTAAGIDGF